MSTTDQRRAALVQERVQKIVGHLLRAHGLSKTLELAITHAAERDDLREDSVKFSSFITSIGQVNDAVHELIDAATDEVHKIQFGAGGEV